MSETKGELESISGEAVRLLAGARTEKEKQAVIAGAMLAYASHYVIMNDAMVDALDMATKLLMEAEKRVRAAEAPTQYRTTVN